MQKYEYERIAWGVSYLIYNPSLLTHLFIFT